MKFQQLRYVVEIVNQILMSRKRQMRYLLHNRALVNRFVYWKMNWAWKFLIATANT